MLVVHFDRDRADESAEDFVREVLVGWLDTRAVVVGHDFHFGNQRRGNVALLQDMGAEFGFDVTGLRLFGAGPGGQPVSSTRIRELLAAGAVTEAAALLGRPHQVRGIVTEGDRRGRELGFPTANVALPASIAVPADGVYAGWYLRPDGARRPAALSLGRRPTFYEEAELSLLEAYLLDFEGDLYGEAARVEFVAHLRGQVASTRSTTSSTRWTATSRSPGRSWASPIPPRAPSGQARAPDRTRERRPGRSTGPAPPAPGSVLVRSGLKPSVALAGPPVPLGLQAPPLRRPGRPGRGPLRRRAPGLGPAGAEPLEAAARFRAWERSSLAATATTGPRRATADPGPRPASWVSRPRRSAPRPWCWRC